MTSYRLTPTDPSMAAEGFALFRDAYLRARQASPLLPELTRNHEARLRRRVERAFAHGGVAAWRGDSLRGFMVAGPSFDYRGSVAALVPEYGHAAAAGDPLFVVRDGVEHETANPLGAAFWQRHFESYLVFSMRTLDRRLLSVRPIGRERR